MFGILLIRKPSGITSHDVVNRVRRILGTRRVGHAGTLDPLATGLLVVAVGPATRFLQYLPLEPKEYVAEVEFGRATTTYDREGETTFTGEVPADLSAQIAAKLPGFYGLIQQIPPVFSAIKVSGKPLYQYAREGARIEPEPRTIHIGAFELTSLEGSMATMRIECSGGTYVRSLAHDLGQEIGCGAHLASLVRTAVGRFSLTEGVDLETVSADNLIPLHLALPPMPLLSLDHDQVRQIREGRALVWEDLVPGSLFGLLKPDGTIFSVARRTGPVLQPECVIPAEAVLDAV
jgi:tRNA pseudouridine55 synthase